MYYLCFLLDLELLPCKFSYHTVNSTKELSLIFYLYCYEEWLLRPSRMGWTVVLHGSKSGFKEEGAGEPLRLDTFKRLANDTCL